MEIKLTKVQVNRLKRDYELLYEQKKYDVAELGKHVNYRGTGESHAIRYILNDAKIEAVHNALLVLGLNIWYNWETEEAHITDVDGNEVTGE